MFTYTCKLIRLNVKKIISNNKINSILNVKNAIHLQSNAY